MEAEKEKLEKEISSGTLTLDELSQKSERYGNLIKLIDHKSERWFELTEIAES